MSTWGIGPFENDDAADWLADLVESSGLETLLEPLDAVGTIFATAQLDLADSASLVAAGSVLLLVLRNERALDDGIDDALLMRLRRAWFELALNERRRLLHIASHAIDYVCTESDSSEIAQLWDDDERISWTERTLQLASRLAEIAESMD